MDEELEISFCDALYDFEFEKAQRIYNENQHEITLEYLSSLLFNYTYKDDFKKLQFVLGLGVDINSTKHGNSIFTDCCSTDVTFEQLKWLHENRADINFRHKSTNQNSLNSLISNGRLPEIKYFIEKGLEYDFIFFRKDAGSGEITHVQTPVDCAIMINQQEIADYLLSLGVKPATQEQIEKHMPTKKSFVQKLFGKLKKVNERKELIEYFIDEVGPVNNLSLKEIVGDFEIISIEPTEDQPWRTLVTYGVSKKAMKTDDEDLKYCEIAIQLPSNWPLDKNSLKNPEYSWPVEWLKDMSVYPFQNDVLIKDQDTIAGDGSAFASNTKLNSFFIMQDPQFHGAMLSNRKFINFYTLIPLYQEECEDIRKNGVVPVITKFEENLIGQTVEIDRPNVITGEGL